MKSIKDDMEALVLSGPREFEIRRIAVPVAGDDEVLCEVDTTFICGTDPHIINGDFPGFWPKAFPFVPGHEWSGTVVRMGERANTLGWRVGDRVCAISHCGCGYCRNCLTGRFNICLNYGDEAKGHRQYGHYTAGAYAQYIRASIKSICKIPEMLDLECSACVDPLSIALYAVKRTRLQPGEDIFILGAGPQGLMAALCAAAMGAGRIIVSGSGERLNKAVELGAIGLNYQNCDVVEEVMRLTNNRGVPRVCECAGTAKSIREACLAASKGGVVSLIGIPHDDPILPIKRIVLDEVELIGNRANPNTAEQAIAMLAENRVDLKPLLTHRFALADFGAALDTYEKRKDGAIKIAIKPNS